MVILHVLNVFIAVLSIMVLITLVRFPSVRKDAEYVKMEMERATYFEEYEHWRRELKKLYLRQIPLVGNLLCKCVNGNKKK